ncbi:splicing factor [Musa troglodytarum]|uniref:Splicing factor n=1 Tax=Musa troglodytarum TaxID=320322 RepID=A0A9E7EQV7_9LILI|nr:splicing factor [Musa troglodytarum]
MVMGVGFGICAGYFDLHIIESVSASADKRTYLWQIIKQIWVLCERMYQAGYERAPKMPRYDDRYGGTRLYVGHCHHVLVRVILKTSSADMAGCWVFAQPGGLW